MELKKKKKKALHRFAKTYPITSSQNLCTARIDIDRQRRRGFPEVIFCLGKTIEEIERIAACIYRHNDTVMLTRANEEIYERVKKLDKRAFYNPAAKLVYIQKKKIIKKGLVLVVSAGTGDIPVAEEAAMTAELMGARVRRLYDVGVAGIHRLLEKTPLLVKAKVLVVVAGMEGALASVVSGMVKKPVIGVPTSVGYGANFSGIAPLLTMLNSCSPGVAVVNIDNGFGAGYMAALINK
ncbi:MAG: nickel pincer cofactor biosynthesis protein LarB [Candidatus Omnitrophica bacterium]|nr:nickel pincer cofactor biosynthesis protein LarB [Candidatus Omnitrophota bacterium]